MATVALNPAFWRGRRVFLTGHTGFKGSWLSLWLQDMGAVLYGYALPPTTAPSLWQTVQLTSLIPGEMADIRDGQRLAEAVTRFRPEIVLHLAAQPLVRESYRTPADTYATNVMGTLNLLEAVRRCDAVRAVLVVTTDKCYENREWPWPYREQDTLGGIDPYSSSKACTELLCASWRDSFLRKAGIALATARAGNVIGGGDWSPERLVPDVLHCWQRNQPVALRYPNATRPWQHVLEPLHGYLILAEAMFNDGDAAASAWNFSPDTEGVASVGEIVQHLAGLWPTAATWMIEEQAQPHEAGLLALDSSKARQRLGWRPRWSLQEALARTVQWHQAWQSSQDMQAFTRSQITEFLNSTP
ncbi:MAG: CDP-glucose 4,6-dehydratase [Stenotrophomonas sp.]